jgi:hypothetical protein
MRQKSKNNTQNANQRPGRLHTCRAFLFHVKQLFEPQKRQECQEKRMNQEDHKEHKENEMLLQETFVVFMVQSCFT